MPGGPPSGRARRWPWAAPLLILILGTAYWTYFVGRPALVLIFLYLRGFTDAELLSTDEIPLNTVAPYLYLPRPPQQSGKTHIPLVLHRTWKTANLSTLPESWQLCSNSCLDLHREWTITLWTDASARALIAAEYAWFLPTYDGYRYPIQRVDALRYFVLYHYGGVYMDLDVCCERPLDPLLDSIPPDTVVFPQTRPCGVSNDVMFAPRRHPFLRRLLHALPCSDHWYGSNYPTVFFSTGPAFLSTNLLFSQPAEWAQVRLLAYSLYGSEPMSFFSHVPGSSWHSSDAEAVKWVAGVITTAADPRGWPWLGMLRLLAIMAAFRRRPWWPSHQAHRKKLKAEGEVYV